LNDSEDFFVVRLSCQYSDFVVGSPSGRILKSVTGLPCVIRLYTIMLLPVGRFVGNWWTMVIRS